MAVTGPNIDTGTLVIKDLGLAEYRQVLALQQKLRDERQRNEIGNTVLIVEHPSVITLGARRSANKLVAAEEMPGAAKIEVVHVRRGGGVTAHNPGQLVFYPIVYLPDLGLGIGEYIRALEAVGIELLGGLRVLAERRRGFPGLWVGEKKIASIGVRVSRQVTYHGMAINVQNDLAIFDRLVPCGLEGVEMTSVLKETGVEQDMGKVKKELARLLTGRFLVRG